MAPICRVKKKVYVPSPEPQVATSVCMTYIGRRRRRTSEDNGKNWSDWKLEYKQAPTQGEFTQSGGESQRGTGPYDPVSGWLPRTDYNGIISAATFDHVVVKQLR